jgi:acetyl esterase/lipase
MSKKNIFLLLVMVLPFVGNAQSDNDTAYKAVEYPAGFVARLNVIYTKVNNWEGKMDLYLPPNLGKPNPIIINIHGGGWNKGVKESQTGFNSFFKSGFAIANIEYRLTGQATAPAAIEDVRCALMYIIKNADALNIDKNKIVIQGSSSGGHLALMAGLLGNNHKFDGNCKGVENVKVAAIIDKYGITDVWDWAYGPTITSKSAVQWLGAKAKDSLFARSVSPLYNVTKQSPPVFIVHGNADQTVPYTQSVDLHEKLMAFGVYTEFETVDGGLHGKFSKEKNNELNKSIINFITNIFKGFK